MKNSALKSVLFCCLLFTATLSCAQNSGKRPAMKPNVKPATKCAVYYQGQSKPQLKVTEATAWCDSLPLLVRGDNGITYKLKSFEVMVIQKEPFLSQDFGIAEGGMPILAYKAIQKSKGGDSVFLKNVMFVDDKNQNQKLPNVVFAIID